jgi:hypothetical protein
MPRGARRGADFSKIADGTEMALRLSLRFIASPRARRNRPDGEARYQSAEAKNLAPFVGPNSYRISVSDILPRPAGSELTKRVA